MPHVKIDHDWAVQIHAAVLERPELLLCLHPPPPPRKKQALERYGAMIATSHEQQPDWSRRRRYPLRCTALHHNERAIWPWTPAPPPNKLTRK